VAVAQYTFTYKQYTEQHNVPAELKNPSLPTWFLISVNKGILCKWRRITAVVFVLLSSDKMVPDARNCKVPQIYLTFITW
jgi:hypothetical protein